MKLQWILLAWGMLSQIGIAREKKQDYLCPSCMEDTCIDCICYVPQYYDLECAWNMFITADFLYWYAQEEKLSYAQVVTFVVVDPDLPTDSQTTIGATTTLKYFDPSWAPGARLGLGINFPSDGWDLFFYWTGYENNKKAHYSVDPFSFTSNGNPSPNDKAVITDFALIFALGSSIHTKWKFHLDTLDLEVGKRFWLSPCFNMRPYLGLRGALTQTKLIVNFSGAFNDPSFGYTLSTFGKWKNSFWGGGAVGGLQPSWMLSRHFSLFSNLEIAFLWGAYKEKVTATNSQIFINSASAANSINYTAPTEKDITHSMQTVLDLSLGLRHETKLCAERYQLSIDVGWEQHMWLAHIIRSNEIGASGLDNNIVFGGLVVRGRFDF